MSDLTLHRIPARRDTGKLLVVLHGRGDSHAGFSWLPQALGFDDLAYLMPDAPDAWGTGHSWYPMPPNQAAGVTRSRLMLDALFAQLAADGQDMTKTALLGFSQGCLMTFDWGGRTAWPLAAYVGISGYVFEPHALREQLHDQAVRPVWLVTHGLRDEVLPYARTADQIEALRATGWPLRFETYDKTHTIDARRELPTIRSFLAEHLSLST